MNHARLRELRNTHGLTQAQPAERGDMSQADISRIERGSTSPTARTLQRTADALETDLRLLVHDRDAEMRLRVHAVAEWFADLFGHGYGGEPGAECALDDVRFNDLNNVEDKHEDNLHYTLGECAVRYLDTTRGRKAILDYFRSQGEWDERFYANFGVSPQGFYAEWTDHRYQLLLVELAQAAQALIGANSAGTEPDCEGVCVHDHYPSADGKHYFVELRGLQW
ncbi:helix-turn-helix domain-containing protein [Candidatus Poriferisodalis sp.]|uniref:helix-turn-helix domain-containing protein n=1 Tax=Candidatus Poriferisodalis sp. TaxID=3101277 RepID=UPI003AF8D051